MSVLNLNLSVLTVLPTGMLFVNSPYNIVTCSCRSHRSQHQLYLHSPYVPSLGSYYTGSMPPLHGRRHTQDSTGKS